jgi:thioredoxin reductase (NADPH)
MNLPGPLALYTRQGCHLCDQFLLDLSLDYPDLAARLSLRDVDTQADWAIAYGLRVPVLAAGDAVLCEGHYDRDRLAAALGL